MAGKAKSASDYADASIAGDFAAAPSPRRRMGANMTLSCVMNWANPLTLSLSPWEREASVAAVDAASPLPWGEGD